MYVSTKIFLLSCLWLSLLVCSSQSRAQWYNTNNYQNPIWRRPLPLAWSDKALSMRRYYPTVTIDKVSLRTVVVDPTGNGDFTRVQSAIDSVPQNNKFWIRIQINAGIYREKVTIPSFKPFIFLEGQGQTTTKIMWGDHADTAQSPTFSSLADNIVVKSLAFVNSYNYPSSNNIVLPAVAALVDGDKTSFYRCGFLGVQDTLWDNRGRHYFKKCIIEGAVDFIFGRAQSIYEECDIKVLGPGFITAHGRESGEQSSGFVFKGCSISGVGPSYLGRPWRSFARVLYFKSYFSDVVDPTGWGTWKVDDESSVIFAEYDNSGPGADTSKRVSWEKNLPMEEWERLTSMSFINQDRWLQQQPYN